jgi:hypothetical protein
MKWTAKLDDSYPNDKITVSELNGLDNDARRVRDAIIRAEHDLRNYRDFVMFSSEDENRND